MIREQLTTGARDEVFRTSARAFFVYYVAIGLCFLGPQVNPQMGLPTWAGLVVGWFLLLVVIYKRFLVEYRVTPRGLAKVWRFPARIWELPWKDLGGVWVHRGLVASLFMVGNVIIRDVSGGPEMVWYGLADPKSVKAVIELRKI